METVICLHGKCQVILNEVFYNGYTQNFRFASPSCMPTIASPIYHGSSCRTLFLLDYLHPLCTEFREYLDSLVIN